jgi:YVTN family beta-propeller protein
MKTRPEIIEERVRIVWRHRAEQALPHSRDSLRFDVPVDQRVTHKPQPTKDISMKNQICKMLTTAVLSASLSLVAGAHTIKTTIPFSFPTLGVAADSIHDRVYVVAPTHGTASTDNLAVIDGNQDVLLKNIAVTEGAAFVAVDELTNRIYVAGTNTTVTPSPSTVTVIDGYTDTVISTIDVTTTAGRGLKGIVVNPLDGLVYVANANDNVIDVIHGHRLIKWGTINLNGNSPAAIAINPFLNRLYIPFGDSQIAVVDAFTKQILTTYGTTLVGVASNVRSGNVFVTDSGSEQTGVLDRRGEVLASVPLDSTPLGVDVDPNTNLAFVAERGLDTVFVIDGSTNTETATVSGVPASYVAVNYSSQKVYVSGRRALLSKTAFSMN